VRASVRGEDYAAVAVGDVRVTSIDGGVPGLTVTAADPFGVNETGGMAEYRVRLNTDPGATVTVTPSSGSIAVATVSDALIFTGGSNGSWRTPQPVTVTGVDDDIDNRPDRTVTITHGTSGGYAMDNLSVSDVAVTVRDDDEAGVSVTSDGTTTLNAVAVTEASGTRNTATWAVALTSEPLANVIVMPEIAPAGIATVSGLLTFTMTNWRMAQTVTVTGLDDRIDNGRDRSATVRHTVTGGGTGDGYASVMSSRTVTVTLEDDDEAGVRLSETAVAVTEASGPGRMAIWTVVLTSEPTGNVIVTPSSNVPGVAMVSDALTFTTANWDTAQTVTATGIDDGADKPNDERVATILHAVSGDDADYNGIAVAPLTLTVEDDDVPSISIATIADSVIEGVPAQFRLTASPVPGRDLTVALTVVGNPTDILSGDPPTMAVLSRGKNSVGIDIATEGDDVDEANATITATLTSPTGDAGYTVAASPDAAASVAIMDDAGALLAQGQVGEVVIRGRNVTEGYRNNPDANATAFTRGWFRTGDQGRLDDDGYLSLTGRLKEIINRGGEKISPREVDEALLQHPSVSQAVTFAMAHERLGEEVAAAVVLRAGAEADERILRTFVGERLADFKTPRRILVLDEIPKGATGKVQRIGLADTLGLND